MKNFTAHDVIEAARECLGTKFRHQGRIPGRSLDCAGIPVYVAKTLGLKYIDVQGYGRLPYGAQLEQILDSQPVLTKFLPNETSPQAGDILVFKFEGDPQHLGICTGDGVIHSYAAVRKVVEHNLSDEWRNRIVYIYRFKDIT